MVGMLVLATVSGAGCSNASDDNGARARAEDYVEAIKAGGFAAGCRFMTPVARRDSGIDARGAVFSKTGKDPKRERCSDLSRHAVRTGGLFNIKTVTEGGSHATVKFEGDRKPSLRLDKLGGEWLVSTPVDGARTALNAIVSRSCVESWNNSSVSDFIAGASLPESADMLSAAKDPDFCTLILVEPAAVSVYQRAGADKDWRQASGEANTRGEKGKSYTVRMYDDGRVQLFTDILDGRPPLNKQAADTSDQAPREPSNPAKPTKCGLVKLPNNPKPLEVTTAGMSCATAIRRLKDYVVKQKLPPGWDMVRDCAVDRLNCGKGDSEFFSADPRD